MNAALRWFLIAGVLAGVARAADAAPQQDIDAASVYWPQKEGLEWVYADSDGHQWTERVLGPDILDGEPVTVVESRMQGAAVGARSYYAVRDGQVLLIASGAPRSGAGAEPQRFRAPIVM